MSFMNSDVIDFYQQVYCIFARGSRRHRAIQQIRLLGNVIWKPFNKRFADLQVRIEYHRRIFKREIQIEDQSILSQHFENFHKYLHQLEPIREEERAKTAREEKVIAGAHDSARQRQDLIVVCRSTTSRQCLNVDPSSRVQTHL